MTRVDPHTEFLEQSATALIGRTPLLAVNYRFMGRKGCIHVKAENFNFTGSVKDRMALHILQQAYQSGVLRPGDPIAEASSGNSGLSFAALGRAMGHPVTIFMPDWMSRERADLIRGVGARLRLVSREEGGSMGALRFAKEMATKNPRCFLPSQFSNSDKLEVHRTTTGPELRYQLGHLGLRPHAFVAGVGTGGTIMGVGTYLKERNSLVRIHPLEPSNAPALMSGFPNGRHRIQGISDECVPSMVKLELLDDIISVHDGDAILMAQRLACRLGLGVGISSGANFLGAIKIQEQMGRDAVVVTLFPDDNKKYLSTDLLKKEPIKLNFLAPFIELLSYQAVKCFDP